MVSMESASNLDQNQNLSSTDNINDDRQQSV